MDRRGFLRRALAAAAAVALPTPALAGSGVCNQCGMTNGAHRSWCTRASGDVEEAWPVPGKFYEMRPGDSVLALMTYALRWDDSGRLTVELVNHGPELARVSAVALGVPGKPVQLRALWAHLPDGRELPTRRVDIDQGSRIAYELGVQQARLPGVPPVRWLPAAHR